MSVPDALPPRSDVSTSSVSLQPDSFEDMFTLTPRLLSDVIESHQGQNFPLDHHDLAMSFPPQLTLQDATDQDLDTGFLVSPITEDNLTFSLA